MGRRASESAPTCVGTGFIALDVIRRSLNDATVLERRHAGGSCGNVLAILAHLGLRTTAVGRIGNDSAGHELVADLQRVGVDTSPLVEEDARATPVVLQNTFVNARGDVRHRFSRECPLCGSTMPGYRPLRVRDVANVVDKLPAPTVCYFDRASPGTVEFARRAREAGAFVVFEPSGINDERLFLRALGVAHVVKYASDRLRDLESLPIGALPPLEIRTQGSRGLEFRTRQGGRTGSWNHLGSFAVTGVRDTAGAGDWCTAGFLLHATTQFDNPLCSITDNNAVERCLRFGQALAALNCRYDGARGLMYAASHKRIMAAARSLLSDSSPRLPAGPPALQQATRSCVFCPPTSSHA